MTRKTFTSEETAILRTSPAVIRTTSRRITYASWFRRYAVVMSRRGERPSDIFRGVGLDPGILGTKRIERCMNRWRTAPSSARTRSTGSSDMPAGRTRKASWSRWTA